MKITITHLFYDLLNLYGESGNVLALKEGLVSQGIDVEIKNISLENELNLSDTDIIYIGAGTENNQRLALNYLKKYFEEINQAFINNKFLLLTGNAIELLGKNIKTKNETIECLNLFDYETTRCENRIVSECLFKFDEIESSILGFENHQGEINGINEPLFTVDLGYGSNKSSKAEGIHKNNLYATYLIGPILVRNPLLLEYFCKKIINEKDPNFNFKPFNLDIEKNAYKNFIKKYQK